jgi:hypothetical protein
MIVDISGHGRWPRGDRPERRHAEDVTRVTI